MNFTGRERTFLNLINSEMHLSAKANGVNTHKYITDLSEEVRIH